MAQEQQPGYNPRGGDWARLSNAPDFTEAAVRGMQVASKPFELSLERQKVQAGIAEAAARLGVSQQELQARLQEMQNTQQYHQQDLGMRQQQQALEQQKWLHQQAADAITRPLEIAKAKADIQHLITESKVGEAQLQLKTDTDKQRAVDAENSAKFAAEANKLDYNSPTYEHDLNNLYTHYIGGAHDVKSFDNIYSGKVNLFADKYQRNQRANLGGEAQQLLTDELKQGIPFDQALGDATTRDAQIKAQQGIQTQKEKDENKAATKPPRYKALTQKEAFETLDGMYPDVDALQKNYKPKLTPEEKNQAAARLARMSDQDAAVELETGPVENLKHWLATGEIPSGGTPNTSADIWMKRLDQSQGKPQEPGGVPLPTPSGPAHKFLPPPASTPAAATPTSYNPDPYRNAVTQAEQEPGNLTASSDVSSGVRPTDTQSAGGSPIQSAGGGATSAGGLYRAMAYGPSQGEYTHDTLYGPLGELRQGDLALSPNLMKQYPLGSYVDVVDKSGKVVLPHQRVADYSYFHPGNPTHDSFEVWNGQDLGHASLRAASSDSDQTSS